MAPLGGPEYGGNAWDGGSDIADKGPLAAIPPLGRVPPTDRPHDLRELLPKCRPAVSGSSPFAPYAFPVILPSVGHGRHDARQSAMAESSLFEGYAGRTYLVHYNHLPRISRYALTQNSLVLRKPKGRAGTENHKY